MISLWNLVGAMVSTATLIQVVVDLISLRHGGRTDAAIDMLAAPARQPICKGEPKRAKDEP